MHKIIVKGIKKIPKILVIVIVSALLLLALTFILLGNSAVQNRIAREAAKQLAVKLNTKVSIGNVNYEFFNTFSFENLYVEDQQQDTLLFVEKAYADFNFWQFFNGKFLFDKVQLDRFKANLVIDTTGRSNLDFVIKAFQRPKKQTSSNVEFNFKEIKIADSRFSFTNLMHSARNDTTLFDGNRMRFYHINAHIGIDHLYGDSLAARIESLSLFEKSGLHLKNINTSVFGWKTGFRMPKVNIELPRSALVMDSVKMSYDSISYLKDIANKVRWQANIHPSSIYLPDLAPLFPNFKNVTNSVRLQSKIRGAISGFSLKGLEVRYGNSLELRTDLDLNGIPNIEETFIVADIKSFQVNKNEAQDLIAKIMGHPFVLPKELGRLGNVKYRGNISGFFSNLVAYGNINTDVGSLETDILLQFENNLRDLKYNGSITTQDFNISKLLASNALGKASFQINTKGSKLFNKPFQGTVKGDIGQFFLNKYNYQNIMLDGSYDGGGFDGELNINDPNLQANFNGVVDLSKKLPVFNFELNVSQADVNALHLTDKYKNSILSFYGNTNMVGNSLDNVNGYLALNNIIFINGDKSLEFNEIRFDSEIGEGKSKFIITSDLGGGTVEGDFKYSTLPQTLRALVENYIPALSGKGSPNKNVKGGNNFLNINLTLSDTKHLSEALELPFIIEGKTTIRGTIDDINQRVELNAQTPFVSFGKNKIQNIDISLNNKDRKLSLEGSAGFYFKKDLVNVDLAATAANDSLYTQVAWQNSDSINYAGELQAVTKFQKIEDLTSAQVNILPTQLVISDSIWDLKASTIDINPDTTFLVHNFKIQNRNQYLILNGLVSKQHTDTLQADMNDLQVGYLLDLLNFDAISIQGKSTGNVNLYSVLHQPIFEANLNVKEVNLNHTYVGDAVLHSRWNRENEAIEAGGTFLDKSGKPLILADGMYSLAQDSLDFRFTTDKVNLAFLKPYLSSIASNVQGIATGQVRMYGHTHNLGFEGSALARDAQVTIDYLKTTYSFSDTIYLTRKSISFKDITIYDEDKNTAKVDGSVTHNGSFKNMKFDVKVRTDNLLALNTKAQDNDFFYGKAYAAGNIHIYGDDSNIYFNINASSRPNTKFYLTIGGAETAKTNDFVTFINKNEQKEEKQKLKTDTDNGSSHIFLNMELDITPDAEIQLIIDPKSGDRITGHGSGNLRLSFDHNNDLRLYGGYTIERGDYVFTLQNLLRKEFKIEQGSSLTWSGDPRHAKLDIRAIHSVTASLRDLMDENLTASLSRTSVPVNVILHITDDLMQPVIKFDIDLPSSDETLKIQLKNTMNTEDMMNRQAAYLLLFGKFYTPEYAKTANLAGNNTMSLFSSAALGTVLGQFNSILSRSLNNFSVGFNVRGSGFYGNEFSSQEYEVPVYFQPNNRLIINGNFGYRNDNLLKNNKFIGDVDIEYLLTDNGKLRLKAFNHTVDRYTLRSAQFIQGVGIRYKETFNSWDELWNYYWKKYNRQKNETPKNEKDSIQ